MAVGKTTAVRYLQENAPYIHISYEDTRAVIEEVRRRKLDKNCYPDYLEIQKLWLNNEVVRYQKAVQYPCSIMDFGAFVEILPGKEGLCHISKLSRQRVEKVTDVLKEGQQIPVKLLEVDKMGRLNLSYIDAVEELAKK